MKKYNILLLLFSIILQVSCSDNEEKVIPSNISNIYSESREGGIFISWDVPVDSNYHYIRLEATREKDNYRLARNISVFTDTILIKNLLARDGVYNIELHTISHTNTHSETVEKFSSSALPVKPVETKFSVKLDLTADNLSTNAQEKNEGPISNLLDGNLDSFFHSSWSESIPAPHYIDIALDEPIDNFQFRTWNRKGNPKGNAEVITILGSNDGKTWDNIITLSEDIPFGSGARYESPVIESEIPYSFIRYRADECYGHDWFNMAELEFYKVWYDIYDPENEEVE